VMMDCPPRVNISHYTHHNFRSGSAFRRVITSCLLSRGRTLTPSFHPSPRTSFSEHLVRAQSALALTISFVSHSVSIHRTFSSRGVSMCASTRIVLALAVESWQSTRTFVAFHFLIVSTSSLILFNYSCFSPRAKHFSIQ